MIIAVDAASRKSGVALFTTHGKLVSARAADVNGSAPGFGASLSRANEMGTRIAVITSEMMARVGLSSVTRVIIEYPRIYKTGPAAPLPGDDLLVLSASAMAAWVNLSALYPNAKIEPIRPQDWKGQVPKKIMTQRILIRLNPEESAVIENPKNDNIVDAVGIGLHAMRRL